MQLADVSSEVQREAKLSTLMTFSYKLPMQLPAPSGPAGKELHTI